MKINGCSFSLKLRLSDDIETKIRKIATKIYGADDVVLYKKAQDMIKKIKQLGLNHLPVCMAKTQYSFTHNPLQSDVYSGFKIDVDDLVIPNGISFQGNVARLKFKPGLCGIGVW